MTPPKLDDIVDVLIRQHGDLRRLCADIVAARGGDRRRLFGRLVSLVHSHELGERMVVHPATRDRTNGGEKVASVSALEEARIDAAIAELDDLGVDHPTFNAKFAVFHQALVDHAVHEERDEFPRLRQHLPTQRLHLMANEIRDVQIMC